MKFPQTILAFTLLASSLFVGASPARADSCLVSLKLFSAYSKEFHSNKTLNKAEAKKRKDLAEKDVHKHCSG